jgi:caa(3)-type oxidase subunit IV
MDQHGVQHNSTKAILIVFMGLAVLTGLTVLLSYAGLPHTLAVAVAFLISATKCTLIASYFMHLRFETKKILYMVLVALFFVIVLVGSLLQDLAFH